MSEIRADAKNGVSGVAAHSAELWLNRLLARFSREDAPEESGIQRQFRLLRFLRRHRLEGLAALAPAQSNSEIYRTTVYEIARRYEQRTAAQLALWEKLKESSLKRGIVLTPLKGISLTLESRMPRYARFFEDIDILVDAGNAEPLVSLLMVAGFSPRYDLCKDQAWLALRSMRNLNFFSKESICSIDVHLSVVPRGFPELDLHSGSAESRLVRDYQLMIVHCLKNRWRRLDKIVDVALLESIMTDDERSVAQEALSRQGYARASEITRALLGSLAADRIGDEADRTAALVLGNWFSGPQTPSRSARLRTPVFFFFTAWYQRFSYLLCRVVFPTENDVRCLSAPFNSFIPAVAIRLARIISVLPLRLVNRCRRALQMRRPLHES